MMSQTRSGPCRVVGGGRGSFAQPRSSRRFRRARCVCAHARVQTARPTQPHALAVCMLPLSRQQLIHPNATKTGHQARPVVKAQLTIAQTKWVSRTCGTATPRSMARAAAPGECSSVHRRVACAAVAGGQQQRACASRARIPLCTSPCTVGTHPH